MSSLYFDRNDFKPYVQLYDDVGESELNTQAETLAAIDVLAERAEYEIERLQTLKTIIETAGLEALIQDLQLRRQNGDFNPINTVLKLVQDSIEAEEGVYVAE